MVEWYVCWVRKARSRYQMVKSPRPATYTVPITLTQQNMFAFSFGACRSRHLLTRIPITIALESIQPVSHASFHSAFAVGS